MLQPGLSFGEKKKSFDKINFWNEILSKVNFLLNFVRDHLVKYDEDDMETHK